MFPKSEIDERDELPPPFCIEKNNFNPHNLMGDFDYSDGLPSISLSSQGILVDKKGRCVNQKGWYTKSQHIVDKDGRKKFD